MSKKIFLSLVILLSILLLNIVKVEAVSEMVSQIPGDVNLDGEVNKADSALLARYLRGREELSDEALRNANVYRDNNIDMADVEVIVKHNSQQYKALENLPYYPFIGDVNFDGVIDIEDAALINKHLEYNGYYHGCMVLQEAQRLNADVYKDGQIDMADVCIIARIDAGLMSDGDIRYTSYNTPYKPVKGDLNFDCKFNLEDIKIFKSSINDEIELDEAQKRNANSLIDYAMDNFELIMDLLNKGLRRY